MNKSEGKRGAIAQRGWALSEATRAAWSANRPPQLSLIKSDFSQLRSQPLHVLPKSPGGHKRMCRGSLTDNSARPGGETGPYYGQVPQPYFPILPLHRNRLRPYLGVVDRPDYEGRARDG